MVRWLGETPPHYPDITLEQLEALMPHETGQLVVSITRQSKQHHRDMLTVHTQPFLFRTIQVARLEDITIDGGNDGLPAFLHTGVILRRNEGAIEFDYSGLFEVPLGQVPTVIWHNNGKAEFIRGFEFIAGDAAVTEQLPGLPSVEKTGIELLISNLDNETHLR